MISQDEISWSCDNVRSWSDCQTHSPHESHLYISLTLASSKSELHYVFIDIQQILKGTAVVFTSNQMLMSIENLFFFRDVIAINFAAWLPNTKSPHFQSYYKPFRLS